MGPGSIATTGIQGISDPGRPTSLMRPQIQPLHESCAERMASADAYLAARTGCFEMRCERYDAALEAMHELGLADGDTVVDVGAGMGEFGARLHTGRGHIGQRDGWACYREPIKSSRARYVPVDAAIDGTDLEHWTPPRRVEWMVCLEVLEHLRAPARLLTELIAHADKGVVVSTPNSEVVDVLGMDSTHVQPVTRTLLEMAGMRVEERSFYGSEADSLFGVWSA